MTEYDVFEKFGTHKIHRLLSIFLPMDYYNAMHVLSDPILDSWYTKTHSPEQLKGIPPNSNGLGPLNWHYVSLVNRAHQYLKKKRDEKSEENSEAYPAIGDPWNDLFQPNEFPQVEIRNKIQKQVVAAAKGSEGEFEPLGWV